MEKNNNVFVRMYRKVPVLWALFLIILLVTVIGLCIPYFLDAWTAHGETARIPDVIGKNLGDAIQELEDADLEVVVSDSVYRQDLPPGSVTDVSPSVKSIVKKGRPIYLTIRAFSPEKVTLDMQLTDISYKQAEAYLKSRGLTVERRYVPSLYPDLVVSVKAGGRSLGLGSKVSVEDVVVLEVGNAPESTGDMAMDMAMQAALEAKEPAPEPTPNPNYDVVQSLIEDNVPKDEKTKTSPQIIQLIKNKFGKKDK